MGNWCDTINAYFGGEEMKAEEQTGSGVKVDVKETESDD